MRVSVEPNVDREPPRRPIRTTKIEWLAGVALFLAVTAGWMQGLASWERGRFEHGDTYVLIAVLFSAASVLATGYLVGRFLAALLLGWVPGVTMIAIGLSMTPEPGGDETGGGLIFVGGLVLMLGWPFYFFPLIGLGAVIRGWRAKQ